ncbi:acyl-ACP--UDP-N-acetylglucosamine O-acyltransferase [Salinarimonas sp.]|uniref:acyl-ACP--UDP-N-acetylglucosamine O-acyltransferase n=1 Tax=Salinarimonas sp. TaxID=2766526 RepID=UPI0032D8C8B0
MTAFVHPTAIVEDGAQLGEGVSIGPFCTVGPEVVLGDGVELLSHVVVTGRTEIGARTKIHPFAAIGHGPQDLKYKGEWNKLIVGADCIIRESVTMNAGTPQGDGVTRVGDRCFFLAYSHVAHDNRIGDGVVLANNVMLAGHCKLGDHVIVGGGAGLHQFVRIGSYAFIGGMSAIENDVIPYGMAMGNRAALAGLNVIGLKRRGFSRESIHDLRRAYRLLFGAEGTFAERLADVEEAYGGHEQVREILAFIRAGGDRSVMTPRESA